MYKWYTQFSTILYLQETAPHIVVSGKIGVLHEKLHVFFQEVDSGQNCSFMGLDKHLNILSHIGAKLVNLFIILNRASIAPNYN